MGTYVCWGACPSRVVQVIGNVSEHLVDAQEAQEAGGGGRAAQPAQQRMQQPVVERLEARGAVDLRDADRAAEGAALCARPSAAHGAAQPTLQGPVATAVRELAQDLGREQLVRAQDVVQRGLYRSFTGIFRTPARDTVLSSWVHLIWPPSEMSRQRLRKRVGCALS